MIAGVAQQPELTLGAKFMYPKIREISLLFFTDVWVIGDCEYRFIDVLNYVVVQLLVGA